MAIRAQPNETQNETRTVPVTTICFINQKGGCGKSSTCFHLGGYLAESGLAVLLIDADPQASLSQGFFGPDRVEQFDSSETITALLTDDSFPPASLVKSTPFERLSLLCANDTLSSHNTPCPENTGLRQFSLYEFVADLTTFDVILVDCPPNLYLCSWCAMVASDFVVIPVPPEDFGTQGLRAVHNAIDQTQALNPKLRLLGHVITRSDGRLLVHQAYEQKLRQLYGESILQTVIPEASAFKVALASRQPVTYYSPKSKAAELTRQLGRELMGRIDARLDARQVA